MIPAWIIFASAKRVVKQNFQYSLWQMGAHERIGGPLVGSTWSSEDRQIQVQSPAFPLLAARYLALCLVVS